MIVVPCYNEGRRLDGDAFLAFATACPDVHFLFVDDGSSDDTWQVLERLRAQKRDAIEMLRFKSNQGKAEAVRYGVLAASVSGPDYVGYWDADLATPLDELPRLRAVLDERPNVQLVLGSRVNLLGRDVRRKLTRHYIGRVFATAIAVTFRLPVYDTQCGAKLFRCNDEVIGLFESPFASRWVFDAELLARAVERRGRSGSAELGKFAFELPLLSWHDAEGSQLRFRHLLSAFRDATRICVRHVMGGGRDRAARGLTVSMAERVRLALSSLSTQRRRPFVFDKIWRAALLVPPFGLLLSWTRLRALVNGPVSLHKTTVCGHRFECRLPDFIQTYLFLFGVWEPDIGAFVRRRLGPGDTFVDVGANIGYHTLIADDAVGVDGRVVAIEASRIICEQLEETLERNRTQSSIRVVNRAVSDARGQIPFFSGPAHNVGLSTTVESRGFALETLVECASLGDLLEDDEIASARLIKIDVEGGEDNVIRGIGRSVESLPENVEIVVEVSPKWWSEQGQTAEEMLRPLTAAGFNVYEIENNLWPWRYLWPNDVRPPRRIHRKLSKRVKRLDLVLSRADTEWL